MDNFLGIAIVGVVASLIIEGINRKFKLDSFGAKMATVGVAILVGGIYFLFQDTIWWQTMLGVLSAASVVYAFFLKSR